MNLANRPPHGLLQRSRAGLATVLLAAIALSGLTKAQASAPPSEGLDHALCTHPSTVELPGDAQVCGLLAIGGSPSDQPRWQTGEGAVVRGGLRGIDVAMRTSDIVLLGEIHDNPAHHAIRAWMIGKAVGPKPANKEFASPALVFEHIRIDQRPALERFAALNSNDGAARDAEALFRLLEWDNSGWPASSMFKPLIDVALAARLPILPGNAMRQGVRTVAKRGLAALGTTERTRLGLDRSFPGPLRAAMAKQLEGSHCGVLPKQAIAPMAAAQRYRDAHLADAALRASGASGASGRVVVLAGNGHVRKDRGIGWYIRQRAAIKIVTSVLLVEVEDGLTIAADYVPRDPDGRFAADFVIFTPRAKRDDPCVAMRARLPTKNRPKKN